MAAETAIVEIRVYKRILCEFRDAVNGCIRRKSAIPGILEEKSDPRATPSRSSAWCKYDVAARRKLPHFVSNVFFL